MPSVKQTLGAWGEREAAKFLERRGFRVVTTNFHTTRGEVDIVAKHGSDFYFIEVKTRRAGPLATDLAITPFKRRRLEKAAAAYSVRHNISGEAQYLRSLLVVYEAASAKVRFRLVEV